MAEKRTVLDYETPGETDTPPLSGVALGAVICASLGCPLLGWMVALSVGQVLGMRIGVLTMFYQVVGGSFTGALLGIAGIVHVLLARGRRRGIGPAITAILMGAVWFWVLSVYAMGLATYM